MRTPLHSGPIFSSPQRPKPPPALRPISPFSSARPNSLGLAAAAAPASAPTHLAEYLCSRLADPPKSDFAHREVTEEVELLIGDQSVRGTTTFVGLRKLEVRAKSSIACEQVVKVKLWSGLYPTSLAVVTRCMETDGGWKIELIFGPCQSRGN